jgi:hypothetical protein
MRKWAKNEEFGRDFEVFFVFLSCFAVFVSSPKR